MPLTRAIADRYWDKVQVGAADQCWGWLGAKAYDGYGRFRLDGKTVLAHRVAFGLWLGRMPEGSMDASCPTPGCCNPRHWSNGSRAAQGRGVLPPSFKGERHPQAILADADIRRIREDYAAGKAGQLELAGQYGRRQEWIGQVVRGERRAGAGGPITLRGRGKKYAA